MILSYPAESLPRNPLLLRPASRCNKNPCTAALPLERMTYVRLNSFMNATLVQLNERADGKRTLVEDVEKFRPATDYSQHQATYPVS